jgi:hypothetical protein
MGHLREYIKERIDCKMLGECEFGRLCGPHAVSSETTGRAQYRQAISYFSHSSHLTHIAESEVEALSGLFAQLIRAARWKGRDTKSG